MLGEVQHGTAGEGEVEGEGSNQGRFSVVPCCAAQSLADSRRDDAIEGPWDGTGGGRDMRGRPPG